ncbi:MAG: redox-sensing transcriptional repressor Rex, partial [Acidimicrobiia bacterium]|nr:redox-sensing transcriptional repressor Rex [Acidimicrobiia bacterium]
MVKQLAGGDPDGPGNGERPRRRIPEATVARLPLYLRSLLEAAETK